MVQSGENAFTVTYEVDQQIKEGDQTRNVSETYTVTVHVDYDLSLIHIFNRRRAGIQCRRCQGRAVRAVQPYHWSVTINRLRSRKLTCPPMGVRA